MINYLDISGQGLPTPPPGLLTIGPNFRLPSALRHTSKNTDTAAITITKSQSSAQIPSQRKRRDAPRDILRATFTFQSNKAVPTWRAHPRSEARPQFAFVFFLLVSKRTAREGPASRILVLCGLAPTSNRSAKSENSTNLLAQRASIPACHHHEWGAIPAVRQSVISA